MRMDAKKQILIETFTNEFLMERYVRFIREFFNKVDLVNPNNKIPNHLSEYTFYINSHTHIANYTDSERNKIAIFAVELKRGRSIERARSMQRNFVAKLLSDTQFDGAIVAFYTAPDLRDDPRVDQRWRLSLVRLDVEFAKGKIKTNLTPAKRFSYLVGKGEPCHTAMDRLYPIFVDEQYNPTLDKIEEAFSVEVVTKDFFEKYKEKYHDLREYLESDPEFMAESEHHHFSSEQFAKKLMGQLAFLYFLQKKGWLGVNALPKTLTEKEYKDAFFARGKSSREAIPLVYVKTAQDCYQLNGAAFDDLPEAQEIAVAGSVKGAAWGTGPKDFVRKLYGDCQRKGKNFFDEYLEPLFYNALNKKRDTNDYYCRLHCRVPFLNGGLFEPLDNYDWENNDFSIPNEMFSNKVPKGEREADGILDIFDRYNFTINEDEPLEREVAVDPEMLGKIFENLLDVKDRKSKGAFYTPREIVHYMCQESLINYLVNETGVPYDDMKNFILYGEIMKDEDTSKQAKQGQVELKIPASVYENLKKIDDALAKVKVADPAVGSGAFPLGMLNEIVKARNNITDYFARELNTYQVMDMKSDIRHPYRLKRDTIKNSIFAVDIEPSAVDITKLRLWLSLVVEQEIDERNLVPHPLPNLDCNIMCGNSLIDEFEGIKLFNDSVLFEKRKNDNWQLSLVQDQTDALLTELFAAQDKLFNEDDILKKNELKERIRKIIDSMVKVNLDGASEETLARYEAVKNEDTKPYFLWKLEFARIFKENGGFDVVIGNPPYYQLSKDKNIDDDYKSYLRLRYGTSGGRLNTFIFFIHLGCELLRRSGILAYIIPNTILTQDYYKDTRRLLVDDTTIKSIVNYENLPFENAVVENVTIIVSKSHTENYNVQLSKGIKNSIELYKSVPINDFKKSKNYVFSINSNNFVDRLFENSIPLNRLCNINQAIALKGDKSLSVKHEYRDGFFRLLDGRNINKYSITWSGMFLDYDINKIHSCKRTDIFLCDEKLFFRRVSSKLIFAYDDEKYFALNTLVVVTLKQKRCSIKYLLGLLNSKLLNYIYKAKFKSTKKVFSEIQARSVGELPIKIADDQSAIVDIVDQILCKMKMNDTTGIDELEMQIDSIVYKLYNLGEEEIKLIDEIS
jgi:adenine-specific DNA-methyltransferase